jgi:hypothetical protein
MLKNLNASKETKQKMSNFRASYEVDLQYREVILSAPSGKFREAVD